jgi:DNA-directed RNA polymerase subunit RPC12/RpoP
MKRTFTCPSCGHRATYRPEGWDRFVRFTPDGPLEKTFYLLVHCARCGREEEVPDVPG